MKASEFSVLVVDDDPMVMSALRSFVESRGHRFVAAAGVAEATHVLASQSFDAVVLDLYLPDGDGLDVLDRSLELQPPPAVIVMTARAEIHSAVEAIRRGAADYLAKPLDLDDLGARLEHAVEQTSMRRKLALFEERQKESSSAVARSAAMKEVLAVAARVAATPSSSALLIGESGVGKEIVAAHIHEMSERRKGPFVRVNLAAIPDSMVEAELFGSVRGAFTDSKRDRAGHFASADGGTLLLDEVCEFKPELQPKLLRALEERRFYPVGSDRERRMNVRVLAATNRDPGEMIAQGSLREDLYYRLATVVVRIPPLRERRDDVLPLAEHFLARFRVELGRPRVTLSPAAAAALGAYEWPGNVRELRNVLERAVIVADSESIGPRDLGLVADAPAPRARGAPPESAAVEPLRLEDVEKEHILRVLARASGSKTRAAAMLGVSRSTLWEKTKRYGID
ncbi:MAG TPA: sigma-54 dependent transcriptional regulator [Polyangiaceae bacterium]|nr:sigma-54 dependent transcriptional regulator [Polyangiaceae bacterium]